MPLTEDSDIFREKTDELIGKIQKNTGTDSNGNTWNKSDYE